MSIFLHAGSGKTVETNRAALERNARDHGDRISFQAAPHFTHVLINSKPVGKLFDSHEKAISYLSNIARTAPVHIAKKAQSALRAAPEKAVPITPAIFAEHIKARVVPRLRTFAAYRKAHPAAKAIFKNGRFLTVR